MKNTHFVLIEAEKIKHLLESKPSAGYAVINQYRCHHCHQFHHTEIAAEMCCYPNCVVCGEPLPKSSIPDTWFTGKKCPSCTETLARERLLNTLRNAERIKLPSTSFLYVPGVEEYLCLDDYEDSAFTLPEIVEQFCLDRKKPLPMPYWVWDCDEEFWQGLSLNNIIENSLEEWFDDAADHIVGLDELAEAFRAFNAKQTLTQYHQSARIIVLNPDAFAEMIKEAE